MIVTNIGIILYSETGNTLSVAERLKTALLNKGHSVSLLKVEAEKAAEGSAVPVRLTAEPDTSAFDALIFASPVQAFSLAPAMKLYLSRIASLKGKKVYCFVTQHLKKNWMGGNRSIRQIQALCKAKGAEAASGGIVHWSHAQREAQIDSVIKKVGAI
jgi:flavodoxin